MLSKIRFKNYKAFEEGEIELRPLTILLGANSIGKSSVINLILMLQQTASARNYKSALRLNGESVGMGEAANIFRNKDTSKPVTIEFEFICQDFFSMAFDRIMREILGKLNRLIKYDESSNEEIHTHSTDESYVKPMIAYARNQAEFFDYSQPSFAKKFNSKNDFILFVDEIEKTFILLKKLSDIKEDHISLVYEISSFVPAPKSPAVLKTTRVSLLAGGMNLFDLKLGVDTNETDKYASVIFSSPLIEKEDIDDIVNESFVEKVQYNSTIFSIFGSRGYLYYFIDSDIPYVRPSAIIYLFFFALVFVKEQFEPNNVYHISPLRAYPKRYYILDDANQNESLNSQDGNSLAEILKENVKIKNHVNKWLKKFNLGVKVDPLHDVIHTLKVNQKGLQLDITDVGFGISQVLPIIVQGFMSISGSITMIEQPEIHLHPKMQADLADLFVEIVASKLAKEKDDIDFISYMLSIPKTSKKCLIVESHSEYLLKRLRRRVSEDKIKPEDIAIYCFSTKDDDQSPTIISMAPVNESGYFKYPVEFMDEEMEKDTISFIRQQLGNNTNEA